VYRFLELYQEARSPKLPARQFRLAVGDEITEVLLRADVVQRCPIATRYPCEGGRLGCPRRVVPNAGHPRFPWVAVCGQAFPVCAEIPLIQADLEEYRTSHERFAGLVRQLLDVRGPFELLDATYSDTVHLGEINDGDGVCDAFLSLATWDRSLPALLAERMLLPRRSVVFVPTSRGVPLELIHRHPPGGHVTLAFLVDFIAARAGKLIVLPKFTDVLAPKTLPLAHFCKLLTNGATRDLSRNAYDAIVRGAEDFDLFVDAVVPRAGMKYAAGRRPARGRFEWVEMSRFEAGAIAELVARATVMKARNLAVLEGILHPARVVEAARRKVDLRLERYKWRAIHTQAAGSKRDVRYVFSPPPELRFAVLAPPRTDIE
jgi:hypothetical protein